MLCLSHLDVHKIAALLGESVICWSFSNSMFRYLLVDHAVPAMCRSLAAARLFGERAHDARTPTDFAQDAPSGLLVRMRRQCSSGKASRRASPRPPASTRSAALVGRSARSFSILG